MFCQIFSACWYESSTNGLGGLILRIPAGPKFLSTTRKNLTILIFLSSLFVAHYCYTETLVIFYKITTWVVSRCIKNVHSTQTLNMSLSHSLLYVTPHCTVLHSAMNKLLIRYHASQLITVNTANYPEITHSYLPNYHSHMWTFTCQEQAN